VHLQFYPITDTTQIYFNTLKKLLPHLVKRLQLKMSTQEKRIIIYLADSKRNISIYLTSTNKSTFKIHMYIYKYRFKTGSQIALFNKYINLKYSQAWYGWYKCVCQKINLAFHNTQAYSQ